jgi:hypothetical protein
MASRTRFDFTMGSRNRDAAREQNRDGSRTGTQLESITICVPVSSHVPVSSPRSAFRAGVQAVLAGLTGKLPADIFAPPP